ncbi:MAG TPA: hypothetical protein VF727_06505 [Allosphingosinicella sp.]
MDRQQLEAFAKKNKVPLLIGGAILLVIAAASGGEDRQGAQEVPTVPIRGSDAAPVSADGSVPATDDSGLVDMEEWRRGERRGDIEQRERIDTIREEQTCIDPDTGERVKVPIDTACE